MLSTLFEYHHAQSLDVPLPLMPLGVEHQRPIVRGEWDLDVPLPLMPLGVEHSMNAHAVTSTNQTLGKYFPKVLESGLKAGQVSVPSIVRFYDKQTSHSQIGKVNQGNF